MRPALVVGLTGGVASGKTRAEQCFRDLAVEVIDADQVSRDILAPGQPALADVYQRFGTQLAKPDGQLDRRALRELIFADAQARADLEQITHPRIVDAIRRWIDGCVGPYCVVSAALMIGGSSRALVDRVLVIDASDELRMQRLIARDGTTPELARAMIQAQLPREARLAAADDIIGNEGSEADLRLAVEACHRRYLELASQTPCR